MPKTVLVVDDEPDLVTLLDRNLSQEGYLVLHAGSGPEALERAPQADVILLDVMLPGLDGWEVCRRLRAEPRTAATPILMLTAKSEEADKVVGLELGADDYLTKPFGMRELKARIRALLRRRDPAGRPEEVVRVGDLAIDAGRREVTLAGRAVDLTATEFGILRYLAERPGRVCAREEILDAVRGEADPVFDRTVDVHMVALRRKLGAYADRIRTVRGVGYKLVE